MIASVVRVNPRPARQSGRAQLYHTGRRHVMVNKSGNQFIGFVDHANGLAWTEPARPAMRNHASDEFRDNAVLFVIVA